MTITTEKRTRERMRERDRQAEREQRAKQRRAANAAVKLDDDTVFRFAAACAFAAR